jgi:hypothetical protein
VLLADFGSGEVFSSRLWFFLFVIWIWLLIVVFGDIFRSRDLSGWGKALWTIFVIVLPYLGVFVYLIARGSRVNERAMEQAQEQQAQFQQHVQAAASSNGSSAAGEIARLAQLRDQGLITESEFADAKAKALA